MKIWKDIPTETIIKHSYPEHSICIFDMDGTLINSEPAHIRSLQSLLKNEKIDWELQRVYKEFSGKADENCFKKIIELYPSFSMDIQTFLSAKNNDLLKTFDQLHAQSQLIDKAILDLLVEMNSKNWRLALVTASEDVLLQKILDLLGRELFEFSLSTKDTVLQKPYPDPYLKAFSLFKVTDPKQVIIFEDSPTGLEAAQSSGAIVNKVEWFENLD